MKKVLAFVSVLSLLLLLAGCGKTHKEKVLDLVEKKYDTILAACVEKDEDALLSIKGITDVNMVNGYVVVFCEGAGISVSSQDYGFYYSESNRPVTIDCNLDIVCEANELTPEGNGFQCVVSGNTFYTEHIKGNIYFYSNDY